MQEASAGGFCRKAGSQAIVEVFGFDEAGAEKIGADAIRRIFAGYGLHQDAKAGLGRRVGRVGRAGADRVGPRTTEKEETPPAAAAHPGQEGGGQGARQGQVQEGQALPVRGPGLMEGRLDEGAKSHGKYVYFAQVFNPVEEGSRPVKGKDEALGPRRARASGFFEQGVQGRGGMPPVDEKLRPPGGEGQRERGAYATGAPHDKGAPSVEAAPVLRPVHMADTIRGRDAAAQYGAAAPAAADDDRSRARSPPMSEPDLSRFTVVLCRADEAGNVGSTCRAMKTMGLTRLVLAGCPAYDGERVRTMAVHAADLYESAVRHPDLATALALSTLSAGFTRRRGERRKSFSVDVERFAAEAWGRGSGEVALVFGNERTGLSAEELDLCSLAVHIPSSEIFPSLNLSQAVQIACYELRKAALGGRTGSYEPAARTDIDAAVARVAGKLGGLGFFRLNQGTELKELLRDTAERAALSPSELRYLEAFLHKMAALSRKAAEGD